jgi:hypothetical protein
MVSSEEASVEPSKSNKVVISLSVTKIRWTLIYCVFALSAMGIYAEIIYDLLDREDPWGLVAFLSLSWEANLPTWAASSLLLICAALLWAIARKAKQTEDKAYRHWYALSAIFAYISLDETAQLHENLAHLLQTGDGLFYFDWVIPASAILVILGMVFYRFILNLCVSTRNLFIAAAVLYVGGALFMELPLGLWVSEHGSSNLGYGLLDWIEETLELTGIAVFLYALIIELLDPESLCLKLDLKK